MGGSIRSPRRGVIDAILATKGVAPCYAMLCYAGLCYAGDGDCDVGKTDVEKDRVFGGCAT
eukprot:183421-Pyramimonas_sp.AAC.1